MHNHFRARNLLIVTGLLVICIGLNYLLGNRRIGVVHKDASQTTQGSVLYTDMRGNEAFLIDENGKVLNSWKEPGGEGWHMARMTPSGDLVVLRQGKRKNLKPGKILVYGTDGTLKKSASMMSHHAFDFLENGHILTLTLNKIERPGLHDNPILSDALTELDNDLQIVNQWYFADHMESIYAMDPSIKPLSYAKDWTHTNSIEVIKYENLVGGDTRFRKGNWIVSIRDIDRVVIIDHETQLPVWVYGGGTLERQHHATMLPSGNILIFNNGTEREYSTVIEVNPSSRQIVWQYPKLGKEGPHFFEPGRGAAQRLSSGNTLIVESNKGHIFEVNPEGEIIWKWVSPELAKWKNYPTMEETEKRADLAIFRAEKIETARF